MSQPTDPEVELLSEIANELREVFAARGHHIEQAIDVDDGFGSGQSRGALARDLVIDAVSGAASRRGLDFRPVSGGGRELRWCGDVADRRYRVRRGRRSADGELVVTASSDSSLAVDGEALSLLRTEPWVFTWVLAPDDTIAEVIAAEVIDFAEGRPGRLVLGRIIPLGGETLPYSGFTPTEEGLPGFDDDELGGEFGTRA